MRNGWMGDGWMRNGFATLLVLSLFTVLPAAAATCPGTVVLQDVFTTPNPALDWTTVANSTFKVQGGKAEFTFSIINFGRSEMYWGTHFGDANICATFSEPATDKTGDQSAGLIFWGTDYNSYYALLIKPGTGQFAVGLYTKGSGAGVWTLPLGWTDSAAIVHAIGSANTLQVETKGNTATLFINGQQVGTFNGTPPSGGGLAGYWAGSSSTTFNTWDVTNFSAASPQTMASAVNSAACPGTVVFQDHFASPDLYLNLTGDTNSQATVAGGKLELEFMKARFWRAAEYTGTRYGDADVCASFSTPPTDKAENQVAGILFWATDYSNMYVFEINTTSGYYEVAQMVAGNWVMLVESVPSGVVAKGMGKTNALRVHTQGDTATVYVNNQDVETLIGVPPAGGGLVGFYAESETSMTAKETWDISNLTIAMP